MIDLDRRFRDLSDKELEAPELLAYRNRSAYEAGATWAEIRACPRVVLLAEAGAGKTEEVQEQVRWLCEEGQTAFLLDVAALGSSAVRDILSPDDVKRLEAWREAAGRRAGFFLMPRTNSILFMAS